MNDTLNPALEIIGATKQYGSVTAISDIHLELSGSEMVALVGPSGCGKTTLLRTIAGLLPLNAGIIKIGGRTVDDSQRTLPPEKRHVGIVFQDSMLFPHLSVADNVGFGIRNQDRSETKRRVAEALEVVELQHHHARFPHELSGGEQQRAALARALAPRPSLMLLDEPFASLDPNLRIQLRRHVVDALKATQTPAVFVTHDQGEAMAAGARIVVMRRGRIEQSDTPYQVFHRPANRFVAAFMGQAAFLSISTDSNVDSTWLGPIEAEHPESSVAMLRPDDVVFSPDDRGNAVVVHTEFHGLTWWCTVELESGETVLSTRPHIDPVAVGTRGWASLTPGHRQVPIPNIK